MKVSDVIIVGGGIQGCAAAYHLAKAGLKVTLLEAETCGRHASGASAGGIRCLNRLVEEIPLSLAAQPLWPKLANELGTDCGFRQTGQIKIAENQEDMEKLKQRAELVRSYGFDHEEIIDRQELKRLVPAVSEHCVGGLICRDDGYAKPFLTTQAYQRKALSLGAQIYERHPVLSIESYKSGWKIKAADKYFGAPKVVNCAGCWSDNIAKMVGDSVSLTTTALALMVTVSVEHFIDPVVGMASRKLSFKQMQNGSVVIGGALNAQVLGDREKTLLNFAQLRESARTVCTVFPQLKNLNVVRTWAGLEAMMPDHLPVIGASPAGTGVYHAFGFSGHGLQLAPIVGIVLKDLVVKDSTEFDLSAFRIDRFEQ